MRASFGASLIFLSFQFFSVDAQEKHPPDNAREQSDPSHRRHLSIEDVNTLLVTEAHNIYGNHRHLKEDSSKKASNVAVDNEWSLSRELERSAKENVGALRRTTVANVTFPYVVCDVEPGKLGERCRATVENHFGSHLVPISNQIDRTCYIVSSFASVAESASDSLLVSPLLPEMKLEQGIVDAIVFDHPMPRKFESIFSPGEASSATEGNLIIDELVFRAKEQQGASRRRLSLFSHSKVERETSDYDRTLQDEDNSDLCHNVFESIVFKVTDQGGSFYFELPKQSAHENDRSCLLLFVMSLAAQPEISWLGIVPGMVPLNSEAQWVSQSRQEEWRPFFDVGLDGTGQVIGVSDTGLDTDNCYFWDATGDVAKDGSVDLSRRKVVQYVSIGDGSDDMKGHGTHVAGTAAGKRASDGISESAGEVDGIAPGAKLSFVDLGRSGQPTLDIPFPPSSIYQHGIEAGSKIHSSSWGIGYNNYRGGEYLLDGFMFNNPDLLIVFAAGNSGDAANAVGSPATCKNGISVGASQNGLSHTKMGMAGEDYLAWFSSAGPTHDGRMKPDVVAPGYFIRSAEARPDVVGECDAPNQDGIDGLMYNAGTSMAAPVVAGTAALIRQYFEEGWYPSGGRVQADSLNPSSSLVKAVLINGAQPLIARQHENFSVSPSEEYDVHQGFGAITLIQSLPLAGKNLIQSQVIDRKPMVNAQEDEYSVTIDKSNGCDEPLSATLVWTDPPGAPSCALCLINDLDLYITDQGQSTMFYPNGRSSRDTVNNAERIRIDSVQDGATYLVRVNGTNLETSSQDYSLIITGCWRSISLSTESDEKTKRQSTMNSTNTAKACPNQDGTILIDDEVGEETCEWLTANADSYGHLCMLTDVATTCSATCGFCPAESSSSGSEPRRLDTNLNGTVEWYGAMFLVEAKNNMTVKSMSFHTRSTDSVEVSVYTKQGIYVGSEQIPKAWTLVASTTVQGRGFGNPTLIPAISFTNVNLHEGDVQSFYVSTGDAKNVILTGGSQASQLQLHDTFADNSDLVLLTGKAVTSSFGGSYLPYAWNGGIDYSIEQKCVDRDDLISIENVGDKSCGWLSKNQGRFGYLCNRIQVSTACPVTCNFCDAIAR